jgi:hypothetical protein
MTDLRESAKSYKLDLQIAISVWDKVCGPHIGPDPFYLAPQMVIERYESFCGEQMLREDVPNWMAFEDSSIEWDRTDFARIMCFETVAPDTEVLLVTDEGLSDGSVFGFPRSAFDDFVRWYEKEYSMEFFQSADYIAFDPGLRYVSIVHHEGIVFRNRVHRGGSATRRA